MQKYSFLLQWILTIKDVKKINSVNPYFQQSEWIL